MISINLLVQHYNWPVIDCNGLNHNHLRYRGSKEMSRNASAYNLQDFISLFGILLTGPIFASGKVPIPKTMELIIDNCQLSKKQHRLERNCDPQSGAQHQTFRGRKHIYKIMLPTYTGQDSCIKIVCVTRRTINLSLAYQ